MLILRTAEALDPSFPQTHLALGFSGPACQPPPGCYPSISGSHSFRDYGSCRFERLCVYRQNCFAIIASFGTLLLLALSLYGIFLCPHLFLKGQIPVNGEIMRFVYPNWYLSRKMLGNLQLPFWNPYRDMGEPFLADPRSMSLYPPYWAVMLLGRALLIFLRVWFLGHTLLAAYFAFRTMRRLEADPEASLATAALLGFGGFFLGHAWYPNQFAAAAFLPVVLYALISRNVIGLAAALSLQWLAGYPPFFFLTFLSAALLALAMDRATLRTFDFAAAAAMGLTTIQWLPFLELLHLSVRPPILTRRGSCHLLFQYRLFKCSK